MTDGQNEIVPVALPAPGWYPDPGNPAMTRWWSGGSWTEYVAPLEDRPTPGRAEIEAPVAAAGAQTASADAEPVVVADAGEAAAAEAIASAEPVVASPTAAPEYVDPEHADPQTGAEPADAAFAPFHPDLSANPEAAAAEQQSWHMRGGANAIPRRGELATTAPRRAAARRPASDYRPNWIAGVAFFLAVVSVPLVSVRVLMDLHPLSQSIAAAAPISISLLALVMSTRRGGRGILLSIAAVLLSAATLAAGLLLPREVVQSATDLVLGYLNIS